MNQKTIPQLKTRFKHCSVDVKIMARLIQRNAYYDILYKTISTVQEIRNSHVNYENMHCIHLDVGSMLIFNS